MSKEKNQIKKAPTSPHLQIYRWNASSLTSIFHRLTGVALYFSVIAISWYIVFFTYQINTGDISESCDCPMTVIMNFIFAAAGIAILFSLFFHFCNGIRHLFWDIGKGFEKETATTNGILVIILSFLLTAVTIGTVLYFKYT
jgi:succinate dehydrogenase / fumarate reductase cytochrome b subunit